MSVDESPLAAAAVRAPRGAGVYFLLADDRELLYVGKAGDLRARLSQHASAKPGPREVRRARLYERVVDVYWEEWVDETAAAAREADLIVSLRPTFNASHVAEGRWNFIVVTEAHREALRFTLTEAAAVRGAYGCFPHLGRGLERLTAVCATGRGAHLRPGIARDRELAAGFFTYGPQALRRLRLHHRRRAGPMPRHIIVQLLAHELRSTIADIRLPAGTDPRHEPLGRHVRRWSMPAGRGGHGVEEVDLQRRSPAGRG